MRDSSSPKDDSDPSQARRKDTLDHRRTVRGDRGERRQTPPHGNKPLGAEKQRKWEGKGIWGRAKPTAGEAETGAVADGAQSTQWPPAPV